MNQAGSTFAAVLALIVSIFVLVFGNFIAWQVKESKSHNQPQTKQVQKSISGLKANAKQSNMRKFFTIKEWAIQSYYDGRLKLSYSFSTDPERPNKVLVSSQQLAEIEPDCQITEAYGNAGYIERYLPSGYIKQDYGPKITAQDYVNQNLTTTDASEGVAYSLVGNYLYIFRENDWDCASSEEAIKHKNQAVSALKQITNSLRHETYY